MQSTRLLLLATLGVGLAAASGANAQLLGGAGAGLTGNLTGGLSGPAASAGGSLAGSGALTGSAATPGATSRLDGVVSHATDSAGAVRGRAAGAVGTMRGRAEDLRGAAVDKAGDVRERAGGDVRSGVIVARMAGDEARDTAQAAGQATAGKVRRTAGSVHPSATAEAGGDVTIHDGGASANGDANGRVRR
jgi:hypothetical protein